MQIYLFFKVLLLSLSFLFLVSCGEDSDIAKRIDNRKDPTYESPIPTDRCQARTYGGRTITLTGLANYQAREITGRGLQGPTEKRPIRFAEVIAVNSDGITKQCGLTSIDGSFSLVLPKSKEAIYNIRVLSKSDGNQLRAIVFNKPAENTIYFIGKNIKSDKDRDMGEFLARYNEDVFGGAFNILDQLLKSNNYLRSELSNCSDQIDDCEDFIVAPMVHIYWEKGFNPGILLGNDSIISFFLPIKNGPGRIFILGGNNGDIAHSDTDHFDNSIIIHEYAHFLANTYFSEISPGGEHGGNRIIDPRLALSEGFATFFQSAVLENPYYIDTLGNSDGMTGLGVFVNIESPPSRDPDSCSVQGCDLPKNEGEGNYREFSVSRFFWDLVDDSSEAEEFDQVSGSFHEIWASFSFEKNNPEQYFFRGIGRIHENQKRLLRNGTREGISGWSSLRRSRDIWQSDKNYAQPIVSKPRKGLCPLIMRPNFNPSGVPIDELTDDLSFPKDLYSNNKFFQILHEGGPLKVALTYKTPGSRVNPDLNLYIKHPSRDSIRITGSSSSVPIVSNQQQVESITHDFLSRGIYIIEVELIFRGANYESLSDPFKKYLSQAFNINTQSEYERLYNKVYNIENLVNSNVQSIEYELTNGAVDDSASKTFCPY